MLQFDLLKTEGHARRGRLTLNPGVVETLEQFYAFGGSQPLVFELYRVVDEIGTRLGVESTQSILLPR